MYRVRVPPLHYLRFITVYITHSNYLILCIFLYNRPTGYVLLKRYTLKSTVLTIAVHSLLKLLARIMETIRAKILCI